MHPNNKYIYEIFQSLYNFISLSNDKDNRFRLATINKTLDIINKLKQPIKKGSELEHFPGIGPRTIERLDEIIETKTLKELNDPNIKIINELTTVVGIGPVKASELIKNYNIKSLHDLMKRKDSLDLNDKIKLGLNYIGKFEGNIVRKEMIIYDKLVNSYSDNTITTTICGSYRRGKAYSNDIDVLLCSIDLITLKDVEQSNLLEEFVQRLKKDKFIIDDIALGKTKYMGFCKYKNNKVRRIDIRLMPLESYITALVYFTGSYELNRIMRSNAKKFNLKLNEYGLYKGIKMIDIMSEEDLFKKLDMEYLEPDERNI